MDKFVLGSILSLSAILGVINCLRYSGALHKIITLGTALSILAVWIGNSYVMTLCLLLFIPLGALTTIYGYHAKELTSAERAGIMTMGSLVAISTLFKTQQWPGATICRLMFILPIVLYASSLLAKKKLPLKEMSFMLTWLIHGTNEISKFWID